MIAAEFKGKKGLRRLWNALGYSRDGLHAAWQNEAAVQRRIFDKQAGYQSGSAATIRRLRPRRLAS